MCEERFFPLTEHESKDSFRQYCRPGGPLSRQNGERMKQYVSRRRRCWILSTQMDPEIDLSEGHRSDMLLDLSGLTREEACYGAGLLEPAARHIFTCKVIAQHRRHVRLGSRSLQGSSLSCVSTVYRSIGES